MEKFISDPVFHLFFVRQVNYFEWLYLWKTKWLVPTLFFFLSLPSKCFLALLQIILYCSLYYCSKDFKKPLLYLCYTTQNLEQNSEVNALSSFWSRNKLVTGLGIFLSAHIITETACLEILMSAKCIYECQLGFK